MFFFSSSDKMTLVSQFPNFISFSVVVFSNNRKSFQCPVNFSNFCRLEKFIIELCFPLE